MFALELKKNALKSKGMLGDSLLARIILAIQARVPCWRMSYNQDFVAMNLNPASNWANNLLFSKRNLGIL